MERIDKIIASQGVYSRSEVKKLIQQKKIKVNGEIMTSPNMKIDAANAKILIDNETLMIKEHIYFSCFTSDNNLFLSSYKGKS